MKKELEIRRCSKCVNRCQLTKPMCETGKKTALEKGIYVTEDEKEEHPGLIEHIHRQRKARRGEW